MMREKSLLTNFILLWLVYSALLLIYPVDATGEEVDLADFPKQLSERLNIPLFAAQILTSGLFLALFLFPTLMLTKNVFAHLMIGFTILSFCVAMGWLPVFLMIMFVLVVVAMMAGKIKEVFT